MYQSLLLGLLWDWELWARLHANASSWGQLLSSYLQEASQHFPVAFFLELCVLQVIQAYCVIQAAGWVTSVPHYSNQHLAVILDHPVKSHVDSVF